MQASTGAHDMQQSEAVEGRASAGYPFAESLARGVSGPAAVVWTARFSGFRRTRFVISVIQISGSMAIAALAVVVAWLMRSSWPASMGEVQYSPLTLIAQIVRVPLAPEFDRALPLMLVAPLVYAMLFQWQRVFSLSTSQIVPFGGLWPIAKAVALGALIVLPVTLAFERGAPAHAIFLLWTYQTLLTWWGVTLFNSAVLIGVLALHAAGVGKTRVAAIVQPEDSGQFSRLLRAPGSARALAGFVSVAPGALLEGGRDWLGAVSDLPALINAHRLDEVVLATDPALLSMEQRLDLAQTCWRMGVELKMVTPFYPFFHTSAHPEQVGGMSLLHVEQVGLYRTWPQVLKRGVDVFVSGLALLVLSPVLLLTMLAIKFDSPGPVFFVQERVGLNGRTFRMMKFRSMRANASSAEHQEYLKAYIKTGAAHTVDKDGNPVYKIASDPRITRFGNFIRKTSIDELPQFINVLRGEMGLVGPRPPIPYEVAEYEAWHLKRLTIRPGITGLWQVSGRSRLSFEEMVKLDIAYIENWSLRRDLWIILKTVPVLLKLDQVF